MKSNYLLIAAFALAASSGFAGVGDASSKEAKQNFHIARATALLEMFPKLTDAERAVYRQKIAQDPEKWEKRLSAALENQARPLTAQERADLAREMHVMRIQRLVSKAQEIQQEGEANLEKFESEISHLNSLYDMRLDAVENTAEKLKLVIDTDDLSDKDSENQG